MDTGVAVEPDAGILSFSDLVSDDQPHIELNSETFEVAIQDWLTVVRDSTEHDETGDKEGSVQKTGAEATGTEEVPKSGQASSSDKSTTNAVPQFPSGKRKRPPGNGGNKTPLQILNEMFAGTCSMRFDGESCEGPPHKRVFKITLHLKGEVFKGESNSKQDAKQVAAKSAVEFFMYCQRRKGTWKPNQMPPADCLLSPQQNSYYRPGFGEPNPNQRFPRPPFDHWCGPPPMRPFHDGPFPPHPPRHPYGDGNDMNPMFAKRPRQYFEQHPQWASYGHPEPMGPWHHDHGPGFRPPFVPLHAAPGIRFQQPGPLPPRGPPMQSGYYDFGPPAPHPSTIHRPTGPYPQKLRPPAGKSASPSPAFVKRKSTFAEDDDLEKFDEFVNFGETNTEETVHKTSAEEIAEEPEDPEDSKIEIKSLKAKDRIRLKLQTNEETEQVLNEHPVSLIHELHPDITWDLVGTEQNGKAITSFKMKLVINDQAFEGAGRTKKLAKFAAARAALSELYSIVIPDILPAKRPDQSGAGDAISTAMAIIRNTIRIEEKEMLNEALATRIGRAIFDHCKVVIETLEETKKWNVLSGIVLTNDDDAQFFKLICLTSGTKCVKGDNLSMMGAALHDCHAEVLARRCFIHYLYGQISELIDNGLEDKSHFIVERREDLYGFRLKKGIQVHLFISSAPCGDARVFSPKDEGQVNDLHPNRISRGVLRGKIEGGEGTIPIKRESSVLTWDGIVQGQQRLQFMSCSDKVAMWNVIGIQGALLSHFLEPIYMGSVVLASLFNFEHLSRAVNGRLNLNFESQSLNGLPEMYRVNKVKIAKAQLPATETQRQLTKTPPYAFNWIIGDDQAEVLSCETGKVHKDGSVSRLAKRTFFEAFRRLLGQNAPTLPSSTLGSNIPLVYRDGKTAAQPYSRAKIQAIQAFQEQNLGNWIHVPSEFDLFGL